MRSFANKHLNKRITRKHSKGQGLVEFAMISLLLFMLVIGIMEMGRMMFIWTQLTSAAEEGARYGVAHPRELLYDATGTNYPYCGGNVATPSNPSGACNIVAQSRARLVLVPTNTVGVEVGYEDGSGTPIHPWPAAAYPPATDCQTAANKFPVFSIGKDRVVVTTTYQFHFLVGIFDNFAPNGLRMQMVAARTIMAPEQTPYPTDCQYTP